MTKQVTIRVRHIGSDGNWRVSGDAAPNRTISMPWGHWNRMYYTFQLFKNFKMTKQPVIFEKGKKDKKFWRKVNRHIEKFAPDA